MNKQKLTKHIDLSNVDPNDKQAIQNLASNIKTQMEDEGKTLQEVVGVNEAFLEKIYSHAYTHYNCGKFTEALHLFDLLVSISPKTYKFLLGSAACLYQLKEFRMALFVFHSALMIEPANALPAYYIADCMIKEGFLEQGIEALDIAIAIAGNNKEFASLKERCKLMKKSILKK